MSNTYFRFKQFSIHQDRCAMKVTTDACLFGAWVAGEMESEKSENKTILDMGTGTGLLSLMLAQKIPEVQIDAIEIEKPAADQARENADASPWKDRVHVIHADAKEFSYNKKYSFIISNPPFYEREIKSGSGKKNIAHHSELLSFGELLVLIKKNLAPGGCFFLLLPYKRYEEISKIFREQAFLISRIVFVRQSVNHPFFRIMIRGKTEGNRENETEISELSIADENGKYTPAFIALLKEYYLHL